MSRFVSFVEFVETPCLSFLVTAATTTVSSDTTFAVGKLEDDEDDEHVNQQARGGGMHVDCLSSRQRPSWMLRRL